MMRPFLLIRDTDVTGVSGTGAVAEGVEFADGTCAMRWRTSCRSTCIYDNVEELRSIHGHDGATRVRFVGVADTQLPARRIEASRVALRIHYFSTYCVHGNHDACRLSCKTCGAPCRCDCHREVPQ